MPGNRISEAELVATVEAYKLHGSQDLAAAAIGVAQSTFSVRMKRAAERGLLLDEPPAMPGFRISQVTTGPDGKQSIQQKPEHGDQFRLPAGHVVKGVSALVNADGDEMLKWVKTKAGEIDPIAIAEALKNSFSSYAPAAAPVPAPTVVSDDLLTLVPCNDWHIGMFAWGKEVGQNWDLKISENTIGPTVEEVIARTAPSAECIILGGGDLLHADSKRNETANGTPQDVDGRYEKIVDIATRLMVRTIDAALAKHQHVTARILKGNHDENAAVAVAYFLQAWYRNEPRVFVDVDPSLYFWFRFGKVLLGATHGHTVKLAAMPGIMAQRRAKDWGETVYRYAHGFHIHHSSKLATESNGVVCESHQAPIPQDAWHFGKGYLSGRSITAITYHREFGERGRVREAILDAA